MITQTSRDPWRAVWQVVTSDSLLAILLIAIAASLAITAWLPQTPTADSIAYAQWRSEAQTRFGDTTSTLQALGLFTITYSLGFRALLALFAACLVLRLIEGNDRLWQSREMAEPTGEWRKLPGEDLSDIVDGLRRRRYRLLSESEAESPLFQADRWPWAHLFPLLIHGGALLLLVGALFTHLWGWRVEGLIVQSGEQIALHDGAEWVALGNDGRTVVHSPGVVTSVDGYGPGVQIGAINDAGERLPLQQATGTDPVTQLTVPLTEDRYIAVPEAQLVLRLTLQPGQAVAAHSPVLVQAYRSPPGRLLTEAIVEEDTQLTVDGVTLELTGAPYAQVTVTCNPGLWPSGIGIGLLMAGVLGSIAWPARQLWVRQGAEQIEGAGDLPPTLMPRPKAIEDKES